MPLDFPSSPTNGQIYDNYYYDEPTAAWRSLSSTVNPIPSTLKNLTVSSNATTGVSLKVTPFTTSSVNLQEWYNTSSTLVASLNVSGDFVANSVTLSNPLPIASGGTGSTTGVTLVPTGAIMMWYTNTPPAGWILCNGQSTASYPALAAIVGANVPNLQGKVPVGRDAADTSFDIIGETGGAKTVTLTSAQIPAHSHPNSLSSNVVASSGHTHGRGDYSAAIGAVNGNIGTIGYVAVLSGIGGGPGTATYYVTGGGNSGGSFNHYTPVYGTSGTPSATTTVGITNADNTGGGGSHDNLQPYIVINYIIKT